MHINFLNFQPKTRLLIVGLGLFLSLTFLIVLMTSTFRSQPAPSEILPPETGIPIQIQNQDPKEEVTFTNYLQAIVGLTTDQEVNGFKDLKKKENLNNGRTGYYFPSSDPLRDNLIETKDGKVIFKRVTAITSREYQQGKFAPYLQQYGKPDAEFTGSKRYGPPYKTYIYPSRGFAFIVNPSTDAVYEIQSFTPVNLKDYLGNWGQDILTEAEQGAQWSEQQDFSEGAVD